MSTNQVILHPVATVRNNRKIPSDDHWEIVESEIILHSSLPDSCFDGIDAFSHLEILFYFNQLSDDKIVSGARHPRDNKDFPMTGIFAQRGAARPNKIGATKCRFRKKEGRSIIVSGLDAIDGTPVLDIKPVFREFLPAEEIVQPEWASRLMKNYWK